VERLKNIQTRIFTTAAENVEISRYDEEIGTVSIEFNLSFYIRVTAANWNYYLFCVANL
jgi:hypothetical protein